MAEFPNSHEFELETIKQLRKKFEAAFSDAQKSGDYSEAEKLKQELDERLTALEALFPKPESKEESYEYLSNPENFSEEKALVKLSYYLTSGVSSGAIARTMACFNSEEAMSLRNRCQYVSEIAYEYYEGLAGVQNPKSWEMRNFLIQGIDSLDLLTSIAGVDSEDAWQIRNNFFNTYYSDEFDHDAVYSELAISLTGIDTIQAWEMREGLINKHASSERISNDVLESLAGIDTEQAWDMRIKLYLNTDDILPVVKSVTGIDTEQAWAYRTLLETMDITPADVSAYDAIFARSLAGINTEKAWDYRDTWFKTKAWLPLLESLAGLDTDRAWGFRSEVEHEIKKVKAWDTNKDYLPNSINGDLTTAIGWRTAKKYQKEKEKK